VTITVVHGKQTESWDRARLRDAMTPHDAVTIDLGAGDGRWAYRYALEHPERCVIAIDPVRENLRELSAKAAAKPARGGAANTLYVVASIEQMPDELSRVADEIFVTLPWGSLMRGVILGEAAALAAIALLGRAGARVRIVLNTRIFDDPVPVEARDLPDVTPDYVRNALTSRYAAAGLHIDSTREMDADEVATLGTTWAKKLSHRRPPPSVLIEATVVGGAGS
jgi:16S rRNA (adenine(1408)-N(1))-methyltransferase